MNLLNVCASAELSCHSLILCRLGCWCSPELCHGDVLVELVNLHCKGTSDDSEQKADTKGMTTSEQQPSLKIKDEQMEAKCDSPGVNLVSLKLTSEESAVKSEHTEQDSSVGASKSDRQREKSKRKKHRNPHLFKKPDTTRKRRASPCTECF